MKDNSTLLEAFGTEGQMAIVDPTKDSPSRTVHVRLLGFTSDTKGYLVQTDDGTQHKTEQVAFDKDLHSKSCTDPGRMGTLKQRMTWPVVQLTTIRDS